MTLRNRPYPPTLWDFSSINKVPRERNPDTQPVRSRVQERMSKEVERSKDFNEPGEQINLIQEQEVTRIESSGMVRSDQSELGIGTRSETFVREVI